MVNQELVNWIKSEEAQGHSEKALIKVLTKQNYLNKDIQEAFDSLKENKNKTPFSLSFTLLAGLGFISLILTAVVLSVASFSAEMIVGYILVILLGTGIGYYIQHIKEKINATDRFGAILGIFSPVLSLIFIILSLKVVQILSKQLARFSAQELSATGGFPDLVSIISAPNLNPVITGMLFYLLCNLFVIVSIIKNKEYQTFLWYLLAPTSFFIIWLIIDLITSPIMKSTLI